MLQRFVILGYQTGHAEPGLPLVACAPASDTRAFNPDAQPEWGSGLYSV